MHITSITAKVGLVLFRNDRGEVPRSKIRDGACVFLYMTTCHSMFTLMMD